MTKRQFLLAAALAGVAAAGVGTIQAGEPDREKCYGVSKAGANDCANATGTHSCAGQATTDNDPNEWNYAPTGTCADKGGSLTAAAMK